MQPKELHFSENNKTVLQFLLKLRCWNKYCFNAALLHHCKSTSHQKSVHSKLPVKVLRILNSRYVEVNLIVRIRFKFKTRNIRIPLLYLHLAESFIHVQRRFCSQRETPPPPLLTTRSNFLRDNVVDAVALKEVRHCRCVQQLKKHSDHGVKNNTETTAKEC